MMRDLEFIFYGLACFDPQPYGYRVLFPDGRDPAPYPVPPHDCWIGVREQTEVLTIHWPGPIIALNNFTVPDRNQLQITGLARTPVDDFDLQDRLGVLTTSDPNFEIDSNPDMMYDVMIDRGVLSAHQQTGGMIVVKWHVEALDGAAVRLNYGEYWIELSPGTTQVILGNTGRSLNPSAGDTDFLLFRKLARDKGGPLPTAFPTKTPLAAATVIHPIDEFSLMCPGADCSCARSHV